MENQVQLSIQDIAATVQVIDLVTSRGAIQGPEMAQVGALRERLAAFVEVAAKAEQINESPDVEPIAEDEAQD